MTRPCADAPKAHLPAGTSAVLDHILAGRFLQALQHSSIQGLLGAHDQAAEMRGPEDYHVWAQARVQGRAQAALGSRAVTAGEDSKDDELQLMFLAAVACLNMFAQHNLTG